MASRPTPMLAYELERLNFNSPALPPTVNLEETFDPRDQASSTMAALGLPGSFNSQFVGHPSAFSSMAALESPLYPFVQSPAVVQAPPIGTPYSTMNVPFPHFSPALPPADHSLLNPSTDLQASLLHSPHILLSPSAGTSYLQPSPYLQPAAAAAATLSAPETLASTFTLPQDPSFAQSNFFDALDDPLLMPGPAQFVSQPQDDLDLQAFQQQPLQLQQPQQQQFQQQQQQQFHIQEQLHFPQSQFYGVGTLQSLPQIIATMPDDANSAIMFTPRISVLSPDLSAISPHISMMNQQLPLTITSQTPLSMLSPALLSVIHTPIQPSPIDSEWSYAGSSASPSLLVSEELDAGFDSTELGDEELDSPLLEDGAASATATKAKRHACTYPGCNKSFTRMNNLKSHIDGAHEHVRKYTCPGCNTSFVRQQDMARHRKQNCRQLRQSSTVAAAAAGGSSPIARYVCEDCGRRFCRQDAVPRHKRKNCPRLKEHRADAPAQDDDQSIDHLVNHPTDYLQQ
ncbi:uncharacterized protein BJ171DRAFT_474080 [Polychytrium aggregatum]|uniref:uncharacterized protein n=1 Tax=Polychytrium aggregatum TaxID=110093 RepID=UPI0022FF3A2A|nr:uncharacterized protein BJ171DRAFT_474080 [Polychytrium aggregatum]KAI9205582.1 hypothetical protein BJ171DRAFT_474080 [Polychytrium aggregatum]